MTRPEIGRDRRVISNPQAVDGLHKSCRDVFSSSWDFWKFRAMKNADLGCGG